MTTGTGPPRGDGATAEWDAACVGQSVTLGGAVNDWWVQITAGTLTGWVSAVVVEVGGNNLPIPNVLQAPTVNV